VKTYRIPTYKRIMVIGDVHFPFASPDSLSMVYALCEQMKPDVVVQVGDLYDMFSASKFPRSLSVMTPRAEMEMARQQAVDMWATIHAIVPSASLVQCVGNHDLRPMIRILDKWPEGEDFVKKALEPMLTFDHVKTIFDPTEELVIDDIWFIHGYRSKLGDHMVYNQNKTVCGHSHRGGVVYKPSGNRIIWELNAGFVADPFSAALSYRKQRLHDWTQGCGIIDNLGPRFVPFA
jgi:predicted phosphodiesterase